MGARGGNRGQDVLRRGRRLLPLGLFALLTALALAGAAASGAGELDGGWGGDGVVTTDLGDDEYGTDVKARPDGKVVVAVYRHSPSSDRLVVVRYRADGSLDPSFGSGGAVTVDAAAGAGSGAWAVALRPDGGVVAAGWAGNGSLADAVVVRLSEAGAVEGITRFDVGGEDDEVYDVVVTSSAIVVAGTALHQTGIHEVFAARLTLAGVLDPTFGGDGIVTVVPEPGRGGMASALAVDGSGRVVVVGSSGDTSTLDTAVVRLLPNGTPDPTFGTNGVVVTDVLPGGLDGGSDVQLLDDGMIVLSSTDDGAALVDYTDSGGLVTAWASGGIARIDRRVDAAFELLAGGAFVLVGAENDDIAVARVKANGTLDTSYGTGGVVQADAGGIDFAAAGASDGGNVLVAGTSMPTTAGPTVDIAVARVATTPTATTTSSTTTSTTTAPPTSSTTTTTATTTIPPPQPAPENHPPIASFVVLGTHAVGHVLTFDGGASGDFDGDPVTMTWSFGDGATMTGVTATHMYATPGSYMVTLTVTDPAGAATRSTQTIVIHAIPPVMVAVNESATLTATAAVVPPAVVAVNETATMTATAALVPPAVVVVNESTAITATAALTPPAVVAATETATVTGTTALAPPIVVTLAESAAVTGTVALMPPAVVAVAEATGVTATASLAPPLVASVAEPLAVVGSVEATKNTATGAARPPARRP